MSMTLRIFLSISAISLYLGCNYTADEILFSQKRDLSKNLVIVTIMEYVVNLLYYTASIKGAYSNGRSSNYSFSNFHTYT